MRYLALVLLLSCGSDNNATPGCHIIPPTVACAGANYSYYSCDPGAPELHNADGTPCFRAGGATFFCCRVVP